MTTRRTLWPLSALACLTTVPPDLRAQSSQERAATKAALEAAVKLSPFVVEEEQEQGYYASQTLAGGRVRQDLKDTGTSIQVVTKEFMEDLGVTGVEELFQYTTGTEVGGILGNFTGAGDNFDGETSTGEARRNPDGATRVRGLSARGRRLHLNGMRLAAVRSKPARARRFAPETCRFRTRNGGHSTWSRAPGDGEDSGRVRRTAACVSVMTPFVTTTPMPSPG